VEVLDISLRHICICISSGCGSGRPGCGETGAEILVKLTLAKRP